jgi:hypothetical protein
MHKIYQSNKTYENTIQINKKIVSILKNFRVITHTYKIRCANSSLRNTKSSNIKSDVGNNFEPNIDTYIWRSIVPSFLKYRVLVSNRTN